MSASEGGAVEVTTAMALEEKGSSTRACAGSTCSSSPSARWSAWTRSGRCPASARRRSRGSSSSRVLFVFPYALVMAELGSAFTQEGGPYEWMKMAWGRLPAGLGAVLYWVTNPLWVGGSLCFIATGGVERQPAHDRHRHGRRLRRSRSSSSGSRSASRSSSLRHGKWIPNVGAIIRVGVLAFFSITVLIYGIEHGVHGYARGRLQPELAGRVPRPRAAAALQLRRLRAPERGRRGDAEPAARRAGDRAAERHHHRARLLDPGLRHPGRAAVEQDHRYRRLPGRRPHRPSASTAAPRTSSPT